MRDELADLDADIEGDEVGQEAVRVEAEVLEVGRETEAVDQARPAVAVMWLS